MPGLPATRLRATLADVEEAAPVPAASPNQSLPVAWVPWFAPALVATLVLDLATKAWIFALPPESLPTWLAHHYNTGVAWSIGSGSPWLVTGLTLVLIPVLGWLWWRHYRPEGRLPNLAFGLILGGALGNAVDRVAARLGHMEGVRDFIVADLHHIGIPYVWPTFNIADSGITVGFAVLLILAALPAAKPRSPPCN
jgi:signal peptidase II